MSLEYCSKFLNSMSHLRNYTLDFTMSKKKRLKLNFADMMEFLLMEKMKFCGLCIMISSNNKSFVFIHRENNAFIFYDVKRELFYVNVLLSIKEPVFDNKISFYYNIMPVITSVHENLATITLKHSISRFYIYGLYHKTHYRYYILQNPIWSTNVADIAIENPLLLINNPNNSDGNIRKYDQSFRIVVSNENSLLNKNKLYEKELLIYYITYSQSDNTDDNVEILHSCWIYPFMVYGCYFSDMQIINKPNICNSYS